VDLPKPAKPHFFCSSCGNEESRWFGRCSGCGAWNSAVEAPSHSSATTTGRATRARWAPAGAATGSAAPRPLATVGVEGVERIVSGLGELDRVLGGGAVPGSLVLVGGDPGIGKSTLMLQLAITLAARGEPVLVVSGEESEGQVRMRAARLGTIPENLLVLCETDLEAVLEAASSVRPRAMIVDSIQTLARAEVEGGPGSITQVRECGLQLLHFAKALAVPVFLVGHVTKDGAVAGPRVLEHMVDAVLYLEGERYQNYRVLRAAKNRFGATHELGVFEMTDLGLEEVTNPSAAFLSASSRSVPGSAVVASLEGSRPLLVEVQALASSSAYGTPQRVTNGVDPRRLAVLLAVLERRVRLRLGRHDVFVTVTGGLTLAEPGTDLGVAMAVASSLKNRPVLDRTLLVGEISLAGEIRRVSRLDARVREAAQLGFRRVAVPAVQAGDAEGQGLEIIPISTMSEALASLLGDQPSDSPSNSALDPGGMAEVAPELAVSERGSRVGPRDRDA
jgi:DNA repair protein RadA/Sms